MSALLASDHIEPRSPHTYFISECKTRTTRFMLFPFQKKEHSQSYIHVRLRYTYDISNNPRLGICLTYRMLKMPWLIERLEELNGPIQRLSTASLDTKTNDPCCIPRTQKAQPYSWVNLVAVPCSMAPHRQSDFMARYEIAQ